MRRIQILIIGGLLLAAALFIALFRAQKSAQLEELAQAQRQALAHPVGELHLLLADAATDLKVLSGLHELQLFLRRRSPLNPDLRQDLHALVRGKKAYLEVRLIPLKGIGKSFSSLKGRQPISPEWQGLLRLPGLQALSQGGSGLFVARAQAPPDVAPRFWLGEVQRGGDYLLALQLDMAPWLEDARTVAASWEGHAALLGAEGELLARLSGVQGLTQTYPRVWERVRISSQGQTGQMRTQQGIYTYQRIDLLRHFEGPQPLGLSAEADFRWYLIFHLDHAELQLLFKDLAQQLTLLYLLCCLLGLGVFWVLRQFWLAHGEQEIQQRSYLENLQATLRSVGEGIVLLEEGGRIRFVNCEAERMLGRHEAELEGEAWTAWLENPEAWREAPPSQWIRLDIKRVGQETLPVQARWEGFSEPDGLALQALALRDLSDVQAFESALFESRHRLEQAQQLGAFGYWSYLPQEGRLELSASTYRLLGYRPETTPDLKRFMKRLVPEEARRLEQIMDQSRLAPLTFQEDLHFHRDDGQAWVFRIQGQAHHGPQGWERTEGTLQDITDLTQAMDELQATQARYRNLLDISPVGISVHVGGRLLYTNQAFMDLVEAESPDQLERYPLLDLLAPEDREKVAGRLQGGYQGRFQPATQLTVITLKGNRKLVEAIGAPVEFDGQPALQSIIQDVSEREEARRALADSEQKYRRLFEAAPDLILIIEVFTAKIVDANPAALRRLGFSREELIGKSIFKIDRGLPVLSAEELMAYCRQYGSYTFETRTLTKSGVAADFEVTSTLIPYQGRNAFMSLSRDITERKRHLARLRASEERFKLFYQQAPVAYQSLNQQGYLREVNPAYCEMLGYEREELIGRWFGDLLQPEQREEFLETFPQFIEAGKTDGRVFRFRRKDGQEVIGELHGRINRDEQGQFQKTHCVFYDITAHQQLEDQLLQAKTAAEQANQAKSQFLANMSHEIRTPMNGLLAMAQHLQTTATTEEQAESLELLDQSAHNLLGVINDILDLSKIEAGKIELDSHEFDLKRELHALASLFGMEAKKKGVLLEIILDEGLAPGYRGASSRLVQVLTNLLSNGLKFTEQGQVRLVARPEGKGVRFEVSDTGPGIPLERQKAVFEPFEQVDNSISRRFGGTGLGLAISTRLVGLMGGQLEMESQPGLGSRFFFTLPLQPTQAPAGPRQKPSKPIIPDLSGCRLLLVEDNLVNQKVALKLLGKTNAQLEVADHGQAALERLRQGAVDLVLMDVQMPVMDGLEATRAIRRGEAGEAARGLPILALTAFAREEDKQRCLEAGMDDFLSKPFEAGDLYAHLAKYLIG